MNRPIALGFAVFAAAFIASAACRAATPVALIFQEQAPKRYDQDFNVSIEYAVAQELGTDGRVLPVVWSMTDPYYRSAVEERIIPPPRINPKLETVRDVAIKLKADYVFWVRAVRDRDKVEADMKVYLADKVVFEDSQKISAKRDEVLDVEAIAASIARTWSFKLNSSVLKNLPSHRRDTPDMDPGAGRKVETPDAPPQLDNQKLAVDAAALAKAGQSAELVNLLREAVDAAPLDPGRRRMLIDYLRSLGYKKLAAEEAKRSSALLPESPEFHILAARAYIESGDTALAQNELNEAVARDPDSFETRLLLGELNLRNLDLSAAVTNLNAAVEKSAAPQALFARALAHALAGDVEKAKADREAAVKDGEDVQAKKDRYETVVGLVDTAIAGAADKVRNLIQAAGRKKGDTSLIPELDNLASRVTGTILALGFVTGPKEATSSNDKRNLALNLLAQCVAQVETSIKEKDDEMLTEAAMNLGEALRQAASAKDDKPGA